MTKQIKLRHRFQYWFDNLMTGGIVPLIIILLLIAGFLTFLVTLFLLAVYTQLRGEIADSPSEVFWQTFMHLIDQGTITGDGDVSWLFRAAMLVPTTFGILLVATLVGLITSRIQHVLDNLRKGRSLVLEENHTVILGWSSKIFSIINELIKANINQDRASIVILADRDKIFMEDEIADKVNRRGRTKIICRTGDPIDLDDLEIVNHHHAKSIIIVSDEEGHTDAQNIKCILAIVNHPNREDQLYNIIAELKTDNNKQIANIIGGDELTLTISCEVIARIAVQTCLQSGLSSVYNKLLDFDSVDIYFEEIEAFQGKRFKECLMAFEEVIPIGIQRPNGIILLNPNTNTRVKPKDKVILLAEDDDKLPQPDFSPHPVHEKFISHREMTLKNGSKRVLILGWNIQGSTIVRELNNYLIKDSEVQVMADDIQEVKTELAPYEPFRNIQVTYKEGDTNHRKTLNQLNLNQFSHVMILSYSEKMDIQEADAHTLVTLMHLRDIKQQQKGRFTIVSEMLDIKNRILAEVAKPDDFIISDHIISLIVSQLAENKELKFVFDELFDSHGAEFYLKPVELYLEHLENVNFYTVMEAAALRQEIAIGYRFCAYARESKKDYGVTLNPKKSDLINFQPGDKVIVLAEDL